MTEKAGDGGSPEHRTRQREMIDFRVMQAGNEIDDLDVFSEDQISCLRVMLSYIAVGIKESL